MALRTEAPPTQREEDMRLRPLASVLVAAAVLFLVVYCLVEWTVAPLILAGVVLVAVTVTAKR